jgi:tRNA(fMet)-specific endonuclease VapC
MKYLLDTNVISELVAKHPDQKVVGWASGVDELLLNLSVITIGEIKKGIEKLPELPRKQELADWLEQDLLERFHDRIVQLDIPVILCWGELAARLENSGKPMPAIDSLIAATALQGEFILVTRNTSDFEHAGVRTLNPWRTT